MNAVATAPTMIASGRIRAGDSFSCSYLRPLSAENERTIDRLIEGAEERGGAATKVTTDHEVIVRVFPRGEA